MILVDVHCHLESVELNHMLEKVIAGARDAGVARMITSSVSPEQWDISRTIAADHKEVEYSIGIHPWYASLSDIRLLEDIPSFIGKGAVAIGEIGLDVKIDNPTMDVQVPIFRKQLEMAVDLDVPVIMHCRGSHGELLKILKETGAPGRGGIIHSFSGSAELAREFMKFNLSFSLGGVLTYRNSRKRNDLMKTIYPTRLMLETDSPDIMPVGAGERPNLPKNILLNLAAAAEILGIGRPTLYDKIRQYGLKIEE